MKIKNQNATTRRNFLTTSLVALGALAFGALLGSCKNKSAQTLKSPDRLASNDPLLPTQNDATKCENADSLSASDQGARKALKYVDKTPFSDKTCANCYFYIQANEGCGGCKVIRGPIHPDGFCISWAQKSG